MAPTYKIAIVQIYPRPGDIEGNYNRAAEHIRSSASQGAQLAVLPEYHLTGYAPEDPSFKKCAGQWKDYLQKYRDLAKECKINIVPGTIMQTAESADKEDKLINVAYFIDEHGEILGQYQKKNLWHPERPHVTSSGYSPHEVIQTSIGPVGILVCWDLAFPEAFRELIANGARIIIIPSEWRSTDCSPEGFARNPHAEALFVDSTVTSRAYENTCAVIYVNAGGDESEGFMGLSQVTVPFVGPICKMGAREEGVRVVDLDMTVVDEAENTYKVRADIAREDWHYDYKHGAEKAKRVE